jgi:aminopeptidase
MLTDPRVAKMAEVLVQYSLGVQPGWQVCIDTMPLAQPLIVAVYRAVLAAGAFPTVNLKMPELDEVLYEVGNDEQLQYASPFQQILWDSFDAIVSIRAEANVRGGGRVDPARIKLRQAGRGKYGKGMLWMQQGRPYSSTQFPTEAYAQEAGMSLSDYENFVFRACMLDQSDPIAAWRAMHDRQQTLVDWLKGKRIAHVESPDIDLTVGIAGRVFINSDGHNNFPSGEIYTGPQEDVTRGHIRFTYPGFYNGNSVEGVELWFEDGQVVRHAARQNEPFLTAMLDTDPGARRLGEFAIGTNPGVDRFTRNVLFDEKMIGTIHCALGAAYPSTGATNKSGIHWDMVADMRAGRITVDGELFYENGQFVI